MTIRKLERSESHFIRYAVMVLIMFSLSFVAASVIEAKVSYETAIIASHY